MDYKLNHYKEKYPHLSEEDIQSTISHARMVAEMSTNRGSVDYERYEDLYMERLANESANS